MIGFYVVFSIFLRLEDSPESKRVGTGDCETGGINEQPTSPSGSYAWAASTASYSAGTPQKVITSSGTTS